MKGTVTGVINATKRSGTGAKGPWNIMEIEVEKEDGAIVTADSFDVVTDGDIVDLEPSSYTSPTTQKTYHGWKAKLPRVGGPKAPQTNDELMQAIRMVYRVAKAIDVNVKALMGPEEPEVIPVDDSPEPAEPTRPWHDVGRPKDDNEPLPEPPEDLESFMNE